MAPFPHPGATLVVAMRAMEPAVLNDLFTALQRRGYTVVGPTVADGAVVYRELSSAAELPVGVVDEQDGGRYRIRHGDQPTFFAWTVGPTSWKRFLTPPRLRLWRARREGDDGAFQLLPEAHPEARYAFVGVRACDLAALAISDRVFTGSEHADPLYATRRRQAFVVAVSCTRAGGTCFCTSMGTGPACSVAHGGFDLALTELWDEPQGDGHGDGRHLLLAAAGSADGEAVLAELLTREASAEEVAAAEMAVERAAASMGRELATAGLPELLTELPEHPHWEEVASRCLACGNCTLVCPTCFCSSVEDRTDLAGTTAERVRRWDSCFTADFSYLHGGSVRLSGASRYRQWLSHKLSTWVAQFGTFGCVGCGRCITWCPVGIDLTAEVRALLAPRAESRAGSRASSGETTHA